MLPKEQRLTKKKDFDDIFKKGKTIKNNCLLFKVVENAKEKDRFGFVVSKKISTKATERNKIKRRLRYAVLQEIRTTFHKTPLDIIIIALTGIKQKSFSELQDIISQSFKKIKKTQ